MTYSVDILAYDLNEVGEAVSAELTTEMEGIAFTSVKKPILGSLPSTDPSTVGIVLEFLNADAINNALKIAFAYFMARKVRKIKVGDIEIEMNENQDLSELAKKVAEKHFKL